jgi:two-component system CheB/CheR fusion protein
VGIGASAGGLEALQVFVGQLEAGGSVAYVVAQHLAPDHPSLIVDLLARVTTLKVLTAEDGADLQPDTIAIAPPNRDISVRGNRLVVVDPEPRYGPSPSVDRLFESIAEHWAERGVAVVLSGTGSDGARGMRAVRAAGGLTMAQAPASARFDGMPTAAIALGGADLVMEPAALAQRLAELMLSGGDWVGKCLPDPEPASLSTVMGQLKHATGIDFSQYKASTLRRQLQRRMAIRQVDSIEGYMQLLATDASEPACLVQNLLVTVTSFFRDPEPFAALGELLRGYLAQRRGRDRLRVWVPGCAIPSTCPITSRSSARISTRRAWPWRAGPSIPRRPLRPFRKRSATVSWCDSTARWWSAKHCATASCSPATTWVRIRPSRGWI